ncbi:peptidylprolyl isomerase [Neolewinella agarilytica]|uniref:peptidylprolyl isomerase n=1 Tax=Neolewinella agarilytica TaxID=478744 RepID=UPI0023570181|nr:peptidylprolyl isomerase [Neolewinella agarilytica]
MRFFVIALFSCLCFLLLTPSCVPPGEEQQTGVVVDLNDATSKHIYNLQNERQADSLLAFLTSPTPSYRYLAARSFGSFPEVSSVVTDSLVALLKDPDELVRAAAAYALGQTGGEGVADKLAMAFDTLGQLREYNAALLAAVGKTGTEKNLGQITAISTYRNTDTLLMSGQAWSIFYFARQGLRSEEGDARMLQLLLSESLPAEVRLPAAAFLRRFPVSLDSSSEKAVRQLLRNNLDPNTTLAAAKLLGKAKTAAGRVALLRSLRDAEDWRIRAEIINALAGYAYASVREPIIERLKDKHPLVRQTAANFLLNHGSAADATFYRQQARDSSRTDIRYTLYAAANRYLPLYFTDYRSRINYDLQQAYAATSDPYQKADIMAALGEFPWNYRTIYELYQQSNQTVIQTAAANALRSISQQDNFDTFFRGSARRVRLDLAASFREMILSGRIGPAAAAGEALTKNADVYRLYLPDLGWMDLALRAFRLPKDIEAYRSVEIARAALAGDPEPEPKKLTNEAQAIDWNILGSDGSEEIVFRTDAGRFTVRLLPDIAPATSSSFLRLLRDNYYDGKVFHRVVPNFVAQGGGPLGDGYGSEEFTLRTESPGIRWDRPGLMGMASAGKDTEGVQFFFTHLPTPHLDGNYTIFGEVVSGQDVVDQITVGTKIESVQLR